jgi:hypothetical protein
MVLELWVRDAASARSTVAPHSEGRHLTRAARRTGKRLRPAVLGSITPAGQITTFSIPSFAGQPNIIIEGIAAGSDGNMWFTLGNGNDVIRASTS